MPELFGEPNRATLYLLGFGLTSAVALVWEFGEFLLDLYFGTRIQRSIGNTMRDLFNGMTGAIFLILAELAARCKAATKLRCPADSDSTTRQTTK